MTTILSPAGSGTVTEILTRLEREADRGVCDTGRYHCRYYSWGEGPALVFVPGLGDDALSFALLASRLMPRFRCIAYDLPGRPGDGFTGPLRYTGLTADLFALLDHLGERQASVCGFSFGSTISLLALHAAPDRLRRGVLVAGFARRPLRLPEWMLARLAVRWPWPMRWLPFSRVRNQLVHGKPFAERPADFWRFFRQRSGEAPMRAVAANAILTHGADLRALLPEIRQPILAIVSDDDPLVSPACTEELMCGLPRIRRVDIPHGGHFTIYSHPNEVAEATGSFLAEA
jgi:3-oxoadipate enol-lactonase